LKKNFNKKENIVDKSTALEGFKRTTLDIKPKREKIILGMFIFAVLIILSFLVSFKTTVLIYSFFVTYIFMSYLVIWIDTYNKNEKLPPEPKKWPNVSIVIPSYNSLHTIFDTIKACKALKYKAKKEIIVVDDGSTDGSYEKLQKEKGIILIKNEKNAGKAAALNKGIKHAKYEIVACIDSDTYPQEDALEKAVRYFYVEEKVGAVAFAIQVNDPKNLIQKIQEVEYMVSFGLFFRTLSKIGGLYVAPGPMVLYKKEIFEKLGFFDEQNIAEDMEITLRMQRYGWKIKACYFTKVRTETPTTLKGLFKQRLRWIRGGIMNFLKYSDILFNPAYGDFGMFITPIVFGSGFIVFLFISWTILQYLKNLLTFGGALILNSKYISLDLIRLPTSIYSIDSFFIFGLINIIFWMLFVYLSFKINKERLQKTHLLPLLVMMWVYPVFIGIVFLSSYLLELTARKYKW